MNRFTTAVCVAAIAASLAAPAIAQDSSASTDISIAPPEESTVPPELQGMVGDWVLEQEDETLPRCALQLTEDQSIGGWQIVMPEPCPAPYPPADSLLSWNVDTTDGSVLLMDGERHVVLRLFEDEDGLYDTAPETTPRFYLTYPYDVDGAGGEAADD